MPEEIEEIVKYTKGLREASSEELKTTKAPILESLRLPFLRLITLAVIIVIWEGISGTLIDPFWISKPSAVFGHLYHSIVSGVLFYHLGITLFEAALGLAVGGFLGALVGLVIGRIKILGELLDPFFIAVYSLPKVALAPLFILYFGIGIEQKVALSAMIVFFFMFFETYTGARDVDPYWINVIKVMGGGRLSILRKVVLPASSVWIFAGLKICVPYSIVGAVVGELLASSKGMGYLLIDATHMFRTGQVFAWLIVLMVIGAVLNQLLIKIEAHVLAWRQIE